MMCVDCCFLILQQWLIAHPTAVPLTLTRSAICSSRKHVWLNSGMTNLVYSDICCIRNARCYFSLQTTAVQPLYAEICPPLLVLQSGALSRMKCNLWNAIVMLVKKKKKMKKETGKRTILLETSHEMRKEIVERNKKHEISQVATQRKRNKTGRKGIIGGTWEFTLWQWRCKDIRHEGQ